VVNILVDYGINCYTLPDRSTPRSFKEGKIIEMSTYLGPFSDEDEEVDLAIFEDSKRKDATKKGAKIKGAKRLFRIRSMATTLTAG